MKTVITGQRPTYHQDGITAGGHQNQVAGDGQHTIVVETDYMKVEVIPFGDEEIKGEYLKVTIIRGAIGNTQLLSMVSKDYFGLVTEKPTLVFSLAEPK